MLNFKKKVWIVKQKDKGILTDSEIASAQDVTRRAVQKIYSIYRLNGLQSLNDKPKGRRIDDILYNLQQEILKLRKEQYGVHKIEGLLKNKELIISHNKIHRFLKSKGLVKLEPKKGRRYKYIDWERKHSNSLWQTDYCWIPRYHKWMIAYVDDHSRLCTGASYTNEATTETAINLLDKAINKWNKPREVLSDRGSQFYAAKGESSYYKEYLNSLGIKLIYSSIKKPTTTGKIERFWLTHNTERWRFSSLEKFINYYNYKRLHMSLDYLTPYEVYIRDLPNVRTY
ncbi:MAG: DDE-type integrase/transposase/recombinase [Nanoarchaeota archaeon]